MALACLLRRVAAVPLRSARPAFSAYYSTASEQAEELPPRESMDYDVVIVGGGPAGLGAGIRLKQLAKAANKELSVCLIDKGAQIGSHILSGNVFEPRALTELFPNWKEMEAPLETKVTKDAFFLLSETKAFGIPHFLFPKELNNDNNYIISLSKLCQWLGKQAEELGVEMFPGFSASEVLYRPDGAVEGVATKDVGIGKDGKPKDTFARGMALRAKTTLFAEGCRGSLSESLMKQFNLREGVPPQTYGLGLKEIWEIPEENHKPGYVQHTLGFPLQDSPFAKTFGGTFMYHMKPNLVLVGFVVGLDYQNPYLSPYEEFQRWKHHPHIAKQLEGGTCVAYGARCLNEGGYNTIPKLSFPGGALIGCSAGFLNSVKIKGSHTALKSGMIAAESVFEAVKDQPTIAEGNAIDQSSPVVDVSGYEEAMRQSWVYKELRAVRNCHGSFQFGLAAGLAYTGLSAYVLHGREPWTFAHTKKDSDCTLPASQCTPIQYPKPDGKLSFDLLTNLSRSGTNHEEQPSHLKVKPELKDFPSQVSYPIYAGPEQRFCPARVYEYSDGSEANGVPQLIINNQNCVHCKCCSIKTPKEFINWTVPEGGGGPNYENM